MQSSFGLLVSSPEPGKKAGRFPQSLVGVKGVKEESPSGNDYQPASAKQVQIVGSGQKVHHRKVDAVDVELGVQVRERTNTAGFGPKGDAHTRQQVEMLVQKLELALAEGSSDSGCNRA